MRSGGGGYREAAGFRAAAAGTREAGGAQLAEYETRQQLLLRDRRAGVPHGEPTVLTLH